MKALAVPLGVLGLGLAMALIAWRGAGDMADALVAVGWGLVAVVLWESLPILLDSLSWRALLRGPDRPGLGAVARARWIRQSVNQLLPVFSIGGEVVGARVLAAGGMSGVAAGASVVVDLTLAVVTQAVFTLFGLALLVIDYGYSGAVGPVLIGTAILLLCVLGFYLAQRGGLFGFLAKIPASVTGDTWLALVGGAERLDGEVRALYRLPGALWRNALWQMASWVAGAGEVWLALYFMGHPVGIVEALVIQSLGRAVRSAAFMVPGGLGVQEAGFMVIAGLLGLGPDVGLALSLVKRVRELVVGVPGLLAWQWTEGRRWWRGRAPRDTA